MMPVYMDSSQPCQMRPQGCYCQGCGNNSQHMSMDAPPPCHGSYVHGNFPAYNAYWPPCYPPQVPHHQCCINHTGFHPPHGAYAPPCYVHPSFPVGYQPWYASEKDVSGKSVGYHCGTCSPQICNPKNGRGVVIEEHGPETEKGDQGDAVLPVRSTNWPYPITWFPHENARNQEHGSSLGSGNHNQPPAEVEAPENMTIQKFPKSWNGCFPFDGRTMKSLVQDQDMNKVQNGKTIELPFDISKLKSLLQGQDAKEAQNQKNREKPGQLPHPIFWIPSYGKWEDVEASESKESGNEGLNLGSCPSDHHGDEGQTNQKEGKEGNFENNVLSDAKEKSSVRNIPVQKHLQEPRNIPVKLLEDHLPKPTEPTKRIEKKEPVRNTEKERSSSSSKASRLPPVCLRIDPLPKKRNGGSKSLSHSKRKDGSITSEETKVVPSLRSKKAESKNVPEACNVKCEEANKEMKMSEGSLDATGTEQESVESNPNLQGRSNCEIVKPCETKENREQPTKKTFTEDDAARMIQTRYRGYDVRRWEPIKKLKEIATIREQMGDIKNRIQALEVSTDQHIEEKEIVVLGEMVMNLLLKVDAVQGLHPSIRDYRKSLARELSSIQDKLDSLKNSSTIAEKEAVNEQLIINSQPCDSPLNLEHSQVTEENKMVSDSYTEKVLVRSPDEHPMSVLDRTDEQPNAEAVEGSGLFETLAKAASSTTIPEKTEEGETVVPVNPSSADGNGKTVTKIEDNKAVVESLEEPVNELPQVVEETLGTSSTRDRGYATGVSEAEANVSEIEDRKEDNDTVLPSEKDVEFSELPAGVDEETCSQDPSPYTHEAQVTAIQGKLDSVKNSSAIAEKEAVNEQLIINSKPCGSPVNLDHSQVAKENKMLSDSNTEKVLVLPPDEHPMSILNRTDEQPDAETEEGSGLFETLAKAACSTTTPENMEEGETVVPVNLSSADGNGTTVTKIEDNKAVVESLEEPLNELPQVVEETLGTRSTQDLDNANWVSEAEANASEKEDKLEDNDTVLLSENDVELSELPARVNDVKLSQDSSSNNTHEAKVTAMEPERASQEETDVYHLPDRSKGIGQEISEPQDEKDQSPETEVIVSEQPPVTGPREAGVVVRVQSPETGLVMKEQPPETGVVKERPPETVATEHEISEETKRLMEENQLFKETMETLVKAGREQLEAISKLTGRVNSLEKKLSRKKRTQTRRRATKPISASSIDAVL